MRSIGQVFQVFELSLNMKKHNYAIQLEWTGNKGSGTFDYRSYSRSHKIIIEGKPTDLLGSSDPNFRGDATRYNPEELFLSSISACHMLWYLHLCSDNGVIVHEYIDKAEGIMAEEVNGSGHFKEVTLKPQVIVTKAEMVDKAESLHHEASKMCFIANSLNFDVGHQAEIVVM